jgi:O-antigen ligase
MSDNAIKALAILLGGTLVVAGLLFYRPGYLANTSYLELFLGAEIMLIAVSNYRKAVFPILVVTFLWAGSAVPMNQGFLQARWAVLGIAASAGLAVYLHARAHAFRTIHLIALFCVLSAFVSASTSAYPSEALLKAVSLLMLLVYVVAGVRMAVPVLSPERFFQKLLLACEMLTWISAVCYLVLRFAIFGNPNSLGAIMAVGVTPMLLWGSLAAETPQRKLRLNIELLLAWVLLLSSYSRASIAGAVIASCLICVSLRQNRLLLKGVAAGIVIAICVAIILPPELDDLNVNSGSFASAFLYKGKEDQGFLGSRIGPWRETWKVIRDKPWFGSGFGTSAITADMTKMDYAPHHIDAWVIREHGNSYLAILEWTGLLGVVPFYFLAALSAANAGRVFLWVRRSSDAFSPALPAAAIIVAGLVDAMFEDWLFAVGYYVCVFFWSISFILADILPEQAVVYAPQALPRETYYQPVPQVH